MNSLSKIVKKYTGEKVNKYHSVENIRFSEQTMFITIDGQEYRYELDKISSKLASATPLERETYCISPSGYGIHWPLLDEDLSIDGLLGVRHSPMVAFGKQK
jgi:hypothetical protein